MISHRPSADRRRNTMPASRWRWVETLLLLLIAFGLVWAILTSTLPYALAASHPELALRLNPNNPVALITLAERARTRLLDLIAPVEPTVAAASKPSTGPEAAAETTASDPPNAPDQKERAAEIESLKNTIRSLARRAIANDPFNAHAFRLLGEVADDPERIRFLMQEAVKRSRREWIAVLWLMADSFERKDFADVVDKADILLRTGSNLTPEAMNYLTGLAATPEGQAPLIATLAERPPWRRSFFETLPNNVQYASTPYELMTALKTAGSAPSDAELAPYLRVLMRENLVIDAHDIWLQFERDDESAPVPLLNDPDFADEPSGLPFEWSIRRGSNAAVEYAGLGENDRSQSVKFVFGVGRSQFPELSQVLVLGPGRYKLSGEFGGMIRAKRGLRWEVKCWRGRELTKTDMIYGHPRIAWQPFNLDIEVPDEESCRSQQLRLFHDARSSSEQLISGEISLRHLSLVAMTQ